MGITLTTNQGRQAVWSYVEGKNEQYVGMFGQEEVTVQEGSKVMESYIWPGGIPQSKEKFEEGIRNHLEGRGSLQLIYSRK